MCEGFSSIHFKENMGADSVEEVGVGLFVEHGKEEERFVVHEKEGLGEHEGFQHTIISCNAVLICVYYHFFMCYKK